MCTHATYITNECIHSPLLAKCYLMLTAKFDYTMKKNFFFKTVFKSLKMLGSSSSASTVPPSSGRDRDIRFACNAKFICSGTRSKPESLLSETTCGNRVYKTLNYIKPLLRKRLFILIHFSLRSFLSMMCGSYFHAPYYYSKIALPLPLWPAGPADQLACWQIILLPSQEV